MAVLAPLHCIGAECTHVYLARDLVTRRIDDAHVIAGDVSDIAVFEKDKAPRYRQQCCHIGGDEILTLAEAYHQRAAAPCGHQPGGVGNADHPQGIGAVQFASRGAQGLKQ